ncbi:MAG: hypothetical protein ACTHLW_06515 [Verrucomicrobiota bacterium]
MSSSLKKALFFLPLIAVLESASAFSLLGPFASWQTTTLGYQVDADIGGPMNLTEEYRWNIKTISYGFDRTFIDYFGQRGVEEVNKAIAILNNLPAVSKMSPYLTEFPLDSRRENSRAVALNLIDLKSEALALLVEEMGLADPDRYTWCLRTRQTFPGDIIDYAVIMRNFDPVTWSPSKYVNGTLYTYTVYDDYYGTDLADAVESTVDPEAPVGTAVASHGISYGQFYTGLTRDDVGGLRYMLRKNNYNYENLLTNMVPSTGGGGPWTPVVVIGTNNTGTNFIGTNVLVTTALRPGVEKILFKQMKNFAGIGLFVAQTNQYTDVYVTDNGRGKAKLVKQKVERDMPVPDIIFAAEDLGDVLGYPLLARRTDTAGWANNASLNSNVGGGANSGPGVIQPPIIISFNNVGPFNINENPGFVDEATAFSGFVWGSFDGTTNEPVVYPNTASVEALENEVLSGGN